LKLHIKELSLSIDKYYQSEKNYLINYIIKLLIENGLKVKDIDKIMVEILRTKDRSKFKYYLLEKHGIKECGICGVVEGLELHHIKSIHRHHEKEFDENNVCFLCSTCHKLVHLGRTKDKKEINKVKTVFKQIINKNVKSLKKVESI